MVIALVLSILATGIATADQHLAIVLPAKMFKRAFEDRDHPPVLLPSSVALRHLHFANPLLAIAAACVGAGALRSRGLRRPQGADKEAT